MREEGGREGGDATVGKSKTRKIAMEVKMWGIFAGSVRGEE